LLPAPDIAARFIRYGRGERRIKARPAAVQVRSVGASKNPDSPTLGKITAF